ncbi:PilN domain-containing protein [Rhodoferax sp. GW822-FHT02A01]|uniref:PilN domain-containing protein n=1 Tax=Rhodoferax sp. GW822-FHT02A01 TaxID=3141537 RepID=UPI00315DD4CF
MPQQINLCTAVSAPQRQRFPASVMVAYLVASLVLLALVSGFWLWSLDSSAKTYEQTLELQAREIKSLQAAIQRGRAAASPVDPALLREVQDQRALIQQRENMLQQVSQGLYQPGGRHSDRLQLLAHSIPADTWVTRVKADRAVFEVSGYTLDTSSLNDWVTRLGQHPLMQGLKLDTVAVNLVPEATAAIAKAAASAPAAAARPMWTFTLLSAAPATGAEASSPTGAKP